MDPWKIVKQFEGKKLRTLGQNKHFDVVLVSSDSLIVMPLSTAKPRPISRTTILDAYAALTIAGHLSFSEIKRNYSDFNPTYVAAILSQLPGVSVRRKPILLSYSK